jgi:hypothetical protein
MFSAHPARLHLQRSTQRQSLSTSESAGACAAVADRSIASDGGSREREPSTDSRIAGRKQLSYPGKIR